MALKGLDDYIMGTHIHYDELVRHYCPNCGQLKDIPMFYELGGWFYQDDNDPYCERCQREMEFVDE